MVQLITFDKPDDVVVAARIVRTLEHDFRFNLAGRISVRSDMNQFTKEDRGVWLQGKGKRPHYYELYWDNVWLCDFDSLMPPETVRYRFLIGFKNAYSDGQISLYAPDEQTEKESELNRRKAEDIIQDEIKRIKASELDATSKEVISEILEEKKSKKLKARKKIDAKQKNIR